MPTSFDVALTQLSFMELVQRCNVLATTSQPTQLSVSISLADAAVQTTAPCGVSHDSSTQTSDQPGPSLSLDVAAQTTSCSASSSFLDAAVQTPSYSPLSRDVSTQFGSRTVSSFSVEASLQTSTNSVVLLDAATQLDLTEFLIGWIFSDSPLDHRHPFCQSPPAVQSARVVPLPPPGLVQPAPSPEIATQTQSLANSSSSQCHTLQPTASTTNVGTHPVRSAGAKRSASTAHAGNHNSFGPCPRTEVTPFSKPNAVVLPMLNFGHSKTCSPSPIATADSDIMHHQFRLSLLQWNPGPARRNPTNIVSAACGTFHAVILQEASDHVPHVSDYFLAYTDNTDLAILLNKDTFEPDKIVTSYKFDSTSKNTWGMVLLIVRALLRRPSKKKDDKSAVASLKKGDWHEQGSVTDRYLGQNSSKRQSSDARQLGFVFQDMTPPKSILRKGTDMPRPIQRVKFTKAIARHTKIRDQNPSLGYICPGEPHERSPNAPKFEDRSREETEWHELGACEAAWKLAKNVFKLKEHERAAFFSSPENRCLPASMLKPEEREFVVDSGASMHMISKKDLSKAEMDTLTKSCSPTIVITANGEVQTHEEAIVYVKELDIFLTMKVLENTPAVLSLGKLCDENGYSYEWINGQKPHLIKDGIRIICNTENFVPIVVPGLTSSSSTSSSSLRTPKKQESHSSSSSSSSSPSSPTVGDMSVREREDASNSDISPVPVSELVDDRTGEPVETQANKIPKPNKKETTIERGNLCDDPEIPEWLQEFRENLVDDEIPLQGGSHASSSHEASLEPTTKRREDLGKHNVHTHFPKDRNCEICKRTKITRAPCRRRKGEAVPRAVNFGDLITADHKVLSDNCESRNNHRYAVVVQDLATQWIQAYPCKNKTSQETQRSLQKFLEPERKPKVIYTDNSLEFGKACEDLSWNHCTSTPHRSETNGIAERAVRRVKEGTSAVLLQSGLNESWWADSMECYTYLRNVTDLLSDGKTPYERRFGQPFKGPIIPFGSLVEYYPITAKDQSRIHQFGKKVLPGLFLGYALYAGGIWKGDVLIADLEELETMDASEIYSKRLNAKEVIFPKQGEFIFPIADGRIKTPGGDQELRTSTLIRPRPIQGEGHVDFLGESEGSFPQPHDSFPDAGEAMNDFWSMSGSFIYRHHVEPRVKLYSPREESFPIPLKYIDVTRTTHTNLDVKQEKRIDDYWNIDGSRDLSDPWTGFTQFTLLDEKAPDGYTWSGGD